MLAKNRGKHQKKISREEKTEKGLRTCRALAGKDDELRFMRQASVGLFFLGELATQDTLKNGVLDAVRVRRFLDALDLLQPHLFDLTSASPCQPSESFSRPTHSALVPHVRQTGNKRLDGPCGRRSKQRANNGEVAHGVVEQVENVGGLHVRGRIVVLLQKVERVAKGILGDDVASARLEHVVHAQHVALLAGLFHAPEQPPHALLHDGLQSADAGAREEGVDGVTPHAVHVVVDCGHDGILLAIYRGEYSCALLCLLNLANQLASSFLVTLSPLANIPGPKLAGKDVE